MTLRYLSILVWVVQTWLPAVTSEAEEISERALVQTESARSPSLLLKTPLSISVVSREEMAPSRQNLGLDEALDLVPGVFAQSARNFAQDTRVSIRGFGAHAPFGIRGIRMLVDGFPTTLPDGHSELDSVDLAFVERIEVIRGPISSLYGGGGGGTVSISTLEPTDSPVLSLRSLVGTTRLSRHSAIARGTADGTGYVLGLASTRVGGYRDHARAHHTVGLAKLERTLSDGTQLEAQFSGVWAPEGQDPGGLTQDEVRDDRQAADPDSRSFNAGEELDQQRVGARVRKPIGVDREIQISAYHLWRDFQNRLPTFAKQVAFDRRVAGGSVLYTDGSGRVFWTSGIDIAQQQDKRRNYQNPGGGRGDLTLDQTETVRSLGSFLSGELDFECGLGIVAGLRYDWTEFKVDDHFLSDGSNDSDRLHFRELSPRFGIRYGRSPRFQAYANYATAFRVPTTTELKPADHSGGFDSRIDPERSTGLEIGAKGLLGRRFVYDVALFSLRVRNALVPFSDETSEAARPETFFHNAGEVRRRGVELGLSALLRPGISLRAVYTYSRFRYHDFDRITLEGGGARRVQELDGRVEPNTPEHSLAAELRMAHRSGLFAVLALRHFSDIEVDDANTLESCGATLSDLRAGYHWRRRGTRITPVLGVRNWSGAAYDGSLRPNAGGARFFEPAPRTEVYAGVELSFEPREWR